MFDIQKTSHDEPCGVHFANKRNTYKVFHSRYYWPTFFKDAKQYICDVPIPHYHAELKISLRTFIAHRNIGHGRDHISTFPTLSCSLLSSIDQFDDLQGNISKEIGQRREDTMEINDPKQSRILEPNKRFGIHPKKSTVQRARVVGSEVTKFVISLPVACIPHLASKID